MLNTIETEKGRKTIQVDFPLGNFTIRKLMGEYPTVSRITLQSRLNEAVSDGSITIAGSEEREGRGRRMVIYNKN